jgi:hypothetical protein
MDRRIDAHIARTQFGQIMDMVTKAKVFVGDPARRASPQSPGGTRRGRGEVGRTCAVG